AAVIGRYTGARTNELPRDCIGGDVVREAFDQIDDVEGESLGASSQFIRGSRHDGRVAGRMPIEIAKVSGLTLEKYADAAHQKA
ncbi:MAG TPA: hypothetical protein VFI56_01620, partial [Vicinamibacterales bacterium]|nr:hypothetical protein [Vicinamibacterales bacterium]